MKKIIPILLCGLLCACAETQIIDTENQKQVESMQNVMELEYRDWETTAEKMTDSMIKSNAFATVQSPVVAIGEIQNDTMQRFDTDILIKKIRKTLINSGRARVTTAFTGEDIVPESVRAKRDNQEYNSSTITPKGTLVAPNMSLTGKMLQRNIKIKSGWFSGVDTRVEYYLQLTLTDVKTGLSLWEDERPIIKEGDHAPTW